VTQLADQPTLTPTVWRIEIWPNTWADDALAHSVHHAAADALGSTPEQLRLRTARVFLIEAALDETDAAALAEQLLSDPVNQTARLGVTPADAQTVSVEVHYLPGVMDPVANTTRAAAAEMFADRGLTPEHVLVRTGYRYDFAFESAAPDPAACQQFADRRLANTVVQAIHTQPYAPDAFSHTAPYQLALTHVAIRDLDDEQLKKLSREGHLFLSLDEMRTIRDHYRTEQRDPTDIELETLAQTWSEHCVHKTLKANVTYSVADDATLTQAQRDQHLAIFKDKPGHEVTPDGQVKINNLLKHTIAAATFRLRDEHPDLNHWLVSVFDDNSGIVRFDDTDGVCIKVETHNHPSALEPYGGAATGIGGCIRDILGSGLGAKPIANTNVFAVAPPDMSPDALPAGVIHPRRVLEQVVAGVRDYGNRQGLPTVNGSVLFQDDYLGNPLVFAGCVGLIPLDKCFGEARPGDRIIALGGRTGRDGIHGATFSSAELTDTHADEFAHAVQIGNAITQKRVLDAMLKARDHEDGCLFSAVTDCGAGGFSSAVGEMGEKVGACVDLDKAPLKYDGLSYTEVWISEAQERMVVAVPAEKVSKLAEICAAEGVEWCDLGQFGWHRDGPGLGDPMLVLRYRGETVGELPMPLMHDGIPMPNRAATWTDTTKAKDASAAKSKSEVGSLWATTQPLGDSLSRGLLDLLSHPNIASKHWIVRQYDHEVQGGSVVKPLVGPEQKGPSDAAVIRPKYNTQQAVILAHGLATGWSEKSAEHGNAAAGDSYQAALAAIDEAVRNAVCVGADPSRIAILDNFCWPGCDDPAQLASLVRACEGCYDGAMAYRTPFVSGKDSLNNQFTTEDGRLITIPQTLLITAMGLMDDATKAVTMDAKQPGDALLIVGTTTGEMGGSHFAQITGTGGGQSIPTTDLTQGPANARAAAALIASGLVSAAHDCSDGGFVVAAAEMAFAGGVGVEVDLAALPTDQPLDASALAFAETPSRYLLEVPAARLDRAIKSLRTSGVPFAQAGTFHKQTRFSATLEKFGRVIDKPLETLLETWRAPLDW